MPPAHEVPKHPPEHDADEDEQRDAAREVRIDHEDETDDELRPAGLPLPVEEQRKTDRAGQQREEQPRRIEIQGQLACDRGRPLELAPNPETPQTFRA